MAHVFGSLRVDVGFHFMVDFGSKGHGFESTSFGFWGHGFQSITYIFLVDVGSSLQLYFWGLVISLPTSPA